MNDLVLNFTGYIHRRDSYFPDGKLIFNKDEQGNFCGVKTQFLYKDRPIPPREFKFAEESPIVRTQLAILRSFCINAREASEDFIVNMAARESDTPFDHALNQFGQADLGVRILDMVIMDAGIVSLRNVTLQTS